MQDLDLVSRLTDIDRLIFNDRMLCINPDDAKYFKTSRKLENYLSHHAEFYTAAWFQRILLETRKEFGQAKQKHIDEMDRALEKIDTSNIALIEDEITHHDMLAVIEELGRYISLETKSLLHPGTTSYDIMDTIRAYLFKKAWFKVIRPKVSEPIEKMCGMSERVGDLLQVGRTHLQKTSPVPFQTTFALNAARLADRVSKADSAIMDLRGKVSGIVGTGASIDMVIGDGKSLEFERRALEKINLKPDLTATQITQKERVVDVGNQISTLCWTLADFTNDVRILYSSDIAEMTSLDNQSRLGLSSADATKNNPIQYENMTATAILVEAGMRILYAMIKTNLQRDLIGSKLNRYEPQGMFTKTYEAFNRFSKSLDKLSIITDNVEENLVYVRKNPGEALVSILRGEGWIHPKYGTGHDFVKAIGVRAKKNNIPLLEIALEDDEFRTVFNTLSQTKRSILDGEVEQYIGSSNERAAYNRAKSRRIINQF